MGGIRLGIISGKETSLMGRRHHSGLSPSMRGVVAILEKASTPQTQHALADALQLSDRGIEYSLDKLLEYGVIKITGTVLNRSRYSKLYARTDVAVQEQKGGLWPREIEILQWIADGKTLNEIAQCQEVGYWVVSKTISQILDRLGAANSVGAVAIGFRRGLLK